MSTNTIHMKSFSMILCLLLVIIGMYMIFGKADANGIYAVSIGAVAFLLIASPKTKRVY